MSPTWRRRTRTQTLTNMSPLLQDVSKKKGTICLYLGFALVLNIVLNAMSFTDLNGLLNILVTLFAVMVVIVEHRNGLSRSNIFFILVAACFNPIFPLQSTGVTHSAITLLTIAGFFLIYSRLRPKSLPTTPDSTPDTEADPTPEKPSEPENPFTQFDVD